MVTRHPNESFAIVGFRLFATELQMKKDNHPFFVITTTLTKKLRKFQTKQADVNTSMNRMIRPNIKMAIVGNRSHVSSFTKIWRKTRYLIQTAVKHVSDYENDPWWTPSCTASSQSCSEQDMPMHVAFDLKYRIQKKRR